MCRALFHPLETLKHLSRAPAYGRWRVIRVHRQPNAGLLRHRDNRLQKVAHSIPCLLHRRAAYLRERREGLNSRIDIVYIGRTAATWTPTIPLDRPMVVKVVLYHRISGRPRGADGSNDFIDILVAPRLAQDDARGHVVEHHDAHDEWSIMMPTTRPAACTFSATARQLSSVQ